MYKVPLYRNQICFFVFSFSVVPQTNVIVNREHPKGSSPEDTPLENLLSKLVTLSQCTVQHKSVLMMKCLVISVTKQCNHSISDLASYPSFWYIDPAVFRCNNNCRLSVLYRQYLWLQHCDQEASEYYPGKGARPWWESGGAGQRLRGQWLCF